MRAGMAADAKSFQDILELLGKSGNVRKTQFDSQNINVGAAVKGS